ncbi:DNA uptake protein, SLBB domain protein [Corynebacterium ulcerans]|uniref:DNA uptake protein, SLBB domain protein n=2 Tax=Corynebacterium ulcerans TaxID=65058 RepID=A0ABD7MQ90_CORUL|nr:DNA uptake protein, SLBB domain protein [Corynebacterium ulcerans]SQG49983.1 DNA uptake protein, SLBB domain protein [Corynebacterium ulcerans]SQH03590.1 DNA uptake protein, SLBB domain protein [Corynebacterium ulcerans]
MKRVQKKAMGRLRELTRPTGTEDVMDVDFPHGVRWEISKKHAVIWAIILIVAVGAITLARGGGSTATDKALRPADLAADTRIQQQSATTTAETTVVVAVVGAVEKSGLYTLPAGARVADALRLATPYPDSDVRSLNQAQKLVDGTQITVPGAGELHATVAPDAVGAPAQENGKTSLNSATAEQLAQLPGVGGKTAEAIIAHRQRIGGFKDIGQLKDVKGIGPRKFEALSGNVML